MPTIPASAVRALRPDWPHDVRSPFFNKNAEMRAFARVRLTRLRLYEKSCDTAGEIFFIKNYCPTIIKQARHPAMKYFVFGNFLEFILLY